MEKNPWLVKKKELTELSKEEENYFWRTHEQYKVEMTDTQSFELYSNFVGSQKEGFVEALYKLNDIMNKLKLEGKISEYAKWSARIKHFENAMKNENIKENEKNKALDDIFGVRIIGASEQELEIIQQELEKNFAVGDKKKEASNMLWNLKRVSEILKECSKEIAKKPRKTKQYAILGEVFDTIEGGIEKAKETVESIYEKENRKKTSREKGYNAKHRYYYLPKNQNSPMMEFQYWTVELDYKCTFGDLSYSEYKDESKEEIQKRYDNKEYKIGYNIPIIYDGADSQGVIKALNSQDSLKKIYPFLDMSQKTDLQQKGEQK